MLWLNRLPSCPAWLLLLPPGFSTLPTSFQTACTIFPLGTTCGIPSAPSCTVLLKMTITINGTPAPSSTVRLTSLPCWCLMPCIALVIMPCSNWFLVPWPALLCCSPWLDYCSSQRNGVLRRFQQLGSGTGSCVDVAQTDACSSACALNGSAMMAGFTDTHDLHAG